MKFTPIYKGKRIEMKIDSTDIPRGGPWSRIVIDLVTRKKFLAKGKACCLPRCFCDAEIFDLGQKRKLKVELFDTINGNSMVFVDGVAVTNEISKEDGVEIRKIIVQKNRM